MNKRTINILLGTTLVGIAGVVFYLTAQGKVSNTTSELDGNKPEETAEPPLVVPVPPVPPNSVESPTITGTAILLSDVLTGWYVVTNEMRDKAVNDALSFPTSQLNSLMSAYSSVSGGGLLKDDIQDALSNGASGQWSQLLTRLNLA